MRSGRRLLPTRTPAGSVHLETLNAPRLLICGGRFSVRWITNLSENTYMGFREEG